MISFGDCPGLALVKAMICGVFGAVAIDIVFFIVDSFFNPTHISTSTHLEAK